MNRNRRNNAFIRYTPLLLAGCLGEPNRDKKLLFDDGKGFLGAVAKLSRRRADWPPPR
jgi:hypothetical protein